jgi:hypothetical protein
MINSVIHRFHRVGVAVAVLILLAGGSWTVAAVLFHGTMAVIGIGVAATIVLALAAWGFYRGLGWVIARFARDWSSD